MRGKGDTVDALELLLGLVAMPVSAGDGHDFDGADAARGGHVRTAAKVFPALAGGAGSVEGDDGVGVGGESALCVVELVGIVFVAEFLEGRVFG